MRKRISVCMLAAMMSVTSMYSFTVQGAENETEQETGIEQESEESETQAEEAVDPMSADRLLMRARDFRPSEILDAYFGEGKWDEALVTNQDSLASERNEYDGEDRTVLIVQSGIGFLAISITYKNEVPDEEIRRQEGEDLLQALNIDITDEYIKQTDIANGDRSVFAAGWNQAIARGIFDWRRGRWNRVLWSACDNLYGRYGIYDIDTKSF